MLTSLCFHVFPADFLSVMLLSLSWVTLGNNLGFMLLGKSWSEQATGCLLQHSTRGRKGCWHPHLWIIRVWWKEPMHWKRPWCWERFKVGGEGGDRGWDGWMASLIQWTWVWTSSRRWRTGKPGVLQSMWSQKVRHDWAIEQNTEHLPPKNQL